MNSITDPSRSSCGDAAFTLELAVDAHVHVHQLEHIDALLDCALTNFRAWAGTRPCVLMLADMRAQDSYASLLERNRSSAWNVTANEDGISLRARRHDGATLAIVAGRQIVTSEKIEVLALGTRQQGPDGASLPATLDAFIGYGALLVLPWGFGKWLGSRGALVSKEFSERSDRVFIGDNGGRPRAWPTPKLIRSCHAGGQPVLSGTDPLPIDGDFARVGSRGIVVEVPVRHEWIGLDLVRGLQEGIARVSQFGEGVSMSRFIRNQVALRTTATHGVRE